MKRSTLLELVDYVNAQSGQKIFTEALMPDIMAMVKANICRALPPNNEDFDPEEDEPILENSWPHLQVTPSLPSPLCPLFMGMDYGCRGGRITARNLRSIAARVGFKCWSRHVDKIALLFFHRWSTSSSCDSSCRPK